MWGTNFGIFYISKNNKNSIMKYLIFIIIFFSGTYILDAQVSMKVIVSDKIAGYNIGDTVDALGIRTATFGGNPDYLVKINNKEYRYFSANKFNVVKPISDFWQKLWFFERSANVYGNGTDPKLKLQLFADCVSYIQNLQVNRLLFNDSYLMDYLLQLIHNICPAGLIKNKGENDFLKVLVMKSDEIKSFSFDNGTIILTTGLLATTKNEEDLAKILVKEIAHIVMDFNYQNVVRQIKSESLSNFFTLLSEIASSTLVNNNENDNQFTFDKTIAINSSSNLLSNNILESQGAIYATDQDKKADEILNTYMSGYYDKLTHISPDSYNMHISKVLTFSAWQNFYSFKYRDALQILNRLGNAGCAEENDYLLMSKIYRTIYNTEESNYEALQFIKTAKNIGILNLLDLSKEEGLIYLRLNDKTNARIALEEYKKGLESQPVINDDDRNELEWVKDVLYKTNN